MVCDLGNKNGIVKISKLQQYKSGNCNYCSTMSKPLPLLTVSCVNGHSHNDDVYEGDLRVNFIAYTMYHWWP